MQSFPNSYDLIIIICFFFFFAELEKLMVYLYRIAKDPEYWKRITNIWFQNLVQKYINQNSVVLA